MVSRKIKSRVGIFFLLLACMFMYSCSGKSTDNRRVEKTNEGEQKPNNPKIPTSPDNPTVDLNKDGLQYVSTLQEYFQKHKYSGARSKYNQNRGILIGGSLDGRKIKIFNSSDCKEEKNLLRTVDSSYGVTEVELPDLEEGTYTFSFLEIDKDGNNLECYTTKPINYRYQRIFRVQDSVITLNETRDEITITGDLSYTKRFNKKILAVYNADLDGNYGIGSSRTVILFEDGSIMLWGYDYSGVSASQEFAATGIQIGTGIQSLYIDKSVMIYNIVYGLTKDGTVVECSLHRRACHTPEYLQAGATTRYLLDDPEQYYEREFKNVQDVKYVNDFLVAVTKDGSNEKLLKIPTGEEYKVDINKNTERIYPFGSTFIRKKSDGSIKSVNDELNKLVGDFSSVEDITSIQEIYDDGHVKDIRSKYVILKKDGNLLTTIPNGLQELKGQKFKKVYGLLKGFVALNADGSLIKWNASGEKVDNFHLSPDFNKKTNPVIDVKPLANFVIATYKDGTTSFNNGRAVLNSIDNIKATYLPEPGMTIFLTNEGKVVVTRMCESGYGWENVDLPPELKDNVPVVNVFMTENRSTNTTVFVKGDGSIVLMFDGRFIPTPSELNKIAIRDVYMGGVNDFAVRRLDGSVVLYAHSWDFGNQREISQNTLVISKEDANGGTIFKVFKVFEKTYFVLLRNDGKALVYKTVLKSDSIEKYEYANKINTDSPIIDMVFLNKKGIVALHEDHTVTPEYTNDTFTDNASHIYSDGNALVILKNDGTVLRFEGNFYDSDPTEQFSDLHDVKEVYPIPMSGNYSQFVFEKNGGTVSTIGWGHNSYQEGYLNNLYIIVKNNKMCVSQSGTTDYMLNNQDLISSHLSSLEFVSLISGEKKKLKTEQPNSPTNVVNIGVCGTNQTQEVYYAPDSKLYVGDNVRVLGNNLVLDSNGDLLLRGFIRNCVERQWGLNILKDKIKTNSSSVEKIFAMGEGRYFVVLKDGSRFII